MKIKTIALAAILAGFSVAAMGELADSSAGGSSKAGALVTRSVFDNIMGLFYASSSASSIAAIRLSAFSSAVINSASLI